MNKQGNSDSEAALKKTNSAITNTYLNRLSHLMSQPGLTQPRGPIAVAMQMMPSLTGMSDLVT